MIIKKIFFLFNKLISFILVIIIKSFSLLDRHKLFLLFWHFRLIVIILIYVNLHNIQVLNWVVRGFSCFGPFRMLTARDGWSRLRSASWLLVVLTIIFFDLWNPRSYVFSWILVNNLVQFFEVLWPLRLLLLFHIFFILRVFQRAYWFVLFLRLLHIEMTAYCIWTRDDFLWVLSRDSSNILSFFAADRFHSRKLLNWTHIVSICP